MKDITRNLVGFIRLKVCIFISTIGIIGFLLFNNIGVKLLFVFLASFLISAGSYSLNNITDTKEDVINRKKINPFVLGKRGLILVSLFFLSGLFFSIFLSFYSIVFSLIGILTSIHYSYFKLKKYFLVKNLYTGFGISIVFLVGTSKIGLDVLYYYFLILFFIVIMSMISDLRDYVGDKAIGFKTLPVFLGYGRALKIVSALISIFSSSLLLFSRIIILLPFSLAIIYSLYKNKPLVSHTLGLYSFIFLMFWLVLGSVFNVYGYV
ncbi:MAG: UbiA family prenyltransferase [Nanoarchaeota archaeon]|nr:UbiA family prenyltransferase [Nanoarchaeota archaeon]